MENVDRTCAEVEEWIRNAVGHANMSGVVVGVSGGVDAAVCAGLCVRALGQEAVTAIVIRTTDNERELTAAHDICAAFRLSPILVNVQEPYEAIAAALDLRDVMAAGNLRDRLRSAILYAYGNVQKRLVVSTVNKNEYLLGYFCKNGSGTSDLMPIGDFYKSEVWSVAEAIGVPRDIIEKAPTGDYWLDQTDEDIIGVTYREQDQLFELIEQPGAPEHSATMRRLQELVNRSEHKRRLPLRFVR